MLTRVGIFLTVISSLLFMQYTVPFASSSLAVAPSSSITVTATPFNSGFLVMPGSIRNVAGYVTGGTTNLVNWSVSSGGSITNPDGTGTGCTSGCPATATVKITATGGTCTTVNSVGSYTAASTSDVTLTMASAEDASKHFSWLLHVCDTTTNAQVTIAPHYQQAYKTQSKTLQSYVRGYYDENVTWAITTQPSGGNATLSDTSNRDTRFISGTVSGDYTVCATSTANGSIVGCGIVFVGTNSMPSYSVTPAGTEPVDCEMDSGVFTVDAEVGSGQTFPDFTTLNLRTWVAGTIVRVHPGTYVNSTTIQGNGTPTAPLMICGMADGSGNLPIMEGTNATENPADAGMFVDGIGAFKIVFTNSFDNTGYALGSTGPDYLSITGFQIQNYNNGLPYTSAAGVSGTYSAAAGVYSRSGQHLDIEGNYFNNTSWGVILNNNTSEGTYRAFSDYQQLIGNHCNNYSFPGSFSTHCGYLQGNHPLVEGNLVENPKLDNTTNPATIDQGDAFKIRGGESIVRYNLMRGLWGGYAVEYNDNEDSAQLESADGNYGTPGETMCANSVWCIQTNNISMVELTEHAEAMAKDFYYGNVAANEEQNRDLQLGSYSAISECANNQGYYCNQSADHYGMFWTFNNTYAEPIQAFLSANTNIGGFTAQPQATQPTVFVANSVMWNDNVNFNAFLGVDSTMVGTFQTNLFAQGTMVNTIPITGGAGTGWGNYSNAYSFTNNSPINLHQVGLSSGNFLTSAVRPYNIFTFAPIGGSSLIGAGTAITNAEIAHMPLRFQVDPEHGYMTARTDSGTTIGAIQSGAQPTFSSIAYVPATISQPAGLYQLQIISTATASDGIMQYVHFRSCGWTSANISPPSPQAIIFFGNCNPVGNVENVVGTGTFGSTFTSVVGSSTFSFF